MKKTGYPVIYAREGERYHFDAKIMGMVTEYYEHPGDLHPIGIDTYPGRLKPTQKNKKTCVLNCARYQVEWLTPEARSKALMAKQKKAGKKFTRLQQQELRLHEIARRLHEQNRADFNLTANLRTWMAEQADAVAEDAAEGRERVALLNLYLRVITLYTVYNTGVLPQLNTVSEVRDWYYLWCESNGLRNGFVDSVRNIVRRHGLHENPNQAVALAVLAWLVDGYEPFTNMTAGAITAAVAIGALEQLLCNTSACYIPFKNPEMISAMRTGSMLIFRCQQSPGYLRQAFQPGCKP